MDTLRRRKKKVKTKIRKRTKPISGRGIEKNIFNNITKHRPKWWIFRFNENRRNPTPADIQISTPKYSILLEVKATGQDYIQKVNIRPKQIERLLSFKKVNKRNISLLCLYFSKNRKYVFVDIEDFIKQAKYRIDYIHATNMGIIVKDWKQIGRYFNEFNKR
jgi:Holliday junction resolvase